MPTDASADALAAALGRDAASELRLWADSRALWVRLAEPRWRAAGHTGAVLVAIEVSNTTGTQSKVILKVCPPNGYNREGNANRTLKDRSSGDYFAHHLVDLAFADHVASSGRVFIFQRIAGHSLQFRTLAEVPDERLAEACEIVVRGILSEWIGRANVHSRETTVAEFLRGEARGFLDADGSVRALARDIGLLSPDAAWITTDDSPEMPNPVLMATEDGPGWNLPLVAVRVLAHGDLHLDNVLLPVERGNLDLYKYRLVDLSTFDDDAPVTRDPVTLMLSVIGHRWGRLRSDELEPLLELVVRPRGYRPPQFNSVVADAIRRTYQAGQDAVQQLGHGDWYRQYLLSVQAIGLLFATFESFGERGRWWYLRLAARAAAEVLRQFNAYSPRRSVTIRRPVAWSTSVAPGPAVHPVGEGPSELRLVLTSSERDGLIDLVAEQPPTVLAAVYRDVVESGSQYEQVDWSRPAAVVEAVLASPSDAHPLPLLFAYVDRLAHRLGSGAAALRLHRWLSLLATRYGIAEAALRQLCADSLRAGDTGPLESGTLVNISQEMRSPDPSSEAPTAPGSLMDTLSDMGGNVTDYAPLRVRQAAPVAVLPPIRIGIPSKNPDFTGREILLQRLGVLLGAERQAAVVPQALHGLGGVGKTQLAIEYLHRHLERYEIVCWVPAEDQSQIRAALVELGDRLGVPPGQDMNQTATLVIEALTATSRSWILIYDNVESPESLRGLLPPAGGDVIITSRNNAAWSIHGDAIEVDVFERAESIELLQKHVREISDAEANQLAEKLGDLPLALEQAAIWHATTGMPVSEYLELFDRNVEALMSEGRPIEYPSTIFGILKVAVSTLREQAPAAAELLELFAYLGSEPISVALLRRAREADLSPVLKAAVQNPIDFNRAIRDVRRHGLARMEMRGPQKLQVHRLIQRVLRQELLPDRLAQSRHNVHRLLASANPGDTEDPSNWAVYGEIRPHVRASEIIASADDDVRLVALDQIRYLFKVGDYEGSTSLGEEVLAAWSEESETSPGPRHELTLIAARHLANALRVKGQLQRARDLDTATFQAFLDDPQFGENHEHTLATANNLGVDWRLAGDFKEALRIERDNVRRHVEVYGIDEEQTWRAQNNLAVSLRYLGDFRGAAELDESIVQQWRSRVDEDDTRFLFATRNLAQDLYGLGQYTRALELQRKALLPFRQKLGERHGDVLEAARAVSGAMRKCGHYAEARDQGKTNYLNHHTRFGPDHVNTLAAMVTYANALRCCGDLRLARSLLRDAVDTYRRVLHPRHALTLAAAVNLAIVLRRSGDRREAGNVGEESLALLRETLGSSHPYTLSASNGRAMDLYLAGEIAEATVLSWETFKLAEARDPGHPDTLLLGINAALNQQEMGNAEGQPLYDRMLAKLSDVLRVDHPEVIDVGRGERAEIDLEVLSI